MTGKNIMLMASGTIDHETRCDVLLVKAMVVGYDWVHFQDVVRSARVKTHTYTVLNHGEVIDWDDYVSELEREFEARDHHDD